MCIARVGDVGLRVLSREFEFTGRVFLFGVFCYFRTVLLRRFVVFVCFYFECAIVVVWACADCLILGLCLWFRDGLDVLFVTFRCTCRLLCMFIVLPDDDVVALYYFW